MRSKLVALLGLSLLTLPALAQYGGREGDVVIYALTSKGNPAPAIVAANTPNSVQGFEIKNPLAMEATPFGPDFPGEFFVNLHNESGDNFRFVIQKEDILTDTNEFLAPGKVLIVSGVDRLVIPNKAPIDLTAGLFAPFPQGTDFGPELPLLEANSFLWSPASFFPLIAKRPAGFIGPANRSGKTGSEYVLDLGSFIGILRWRGFESLYGAGWPQGVDEKLIERDTNLGSTARLLRLRPGRKTPPFLIRGNTHLAVLSGSVQIIPVTGVPQVLTAKQYAFIPNGYAVVLSNPKVYDGPTSGR